MILELLDGFLRRVATSRNAVCILLIVSFSAVEETCVSPAQGQNTSAKHAEVMMLYEEGISQAKSGHIDAAITAFGKGLRIEPNNASLLDATGAAYSMKGNLEDAREFFLKSLQLDPNSVSTRQNLGIVLFGLGQYDDAAVQFRPLVSLQGKPHAVADLFLGMIAARRSNCKEAVPLLESSSGLLRRYPEALLSYSQCEYSMGNSTNAVRALKTIEQLSSITPAESRQAADLETRLGLSKEAEEDRSRTQSFETQTMDGVLRQSALLEKANRLQQAEDLLEREADSRPGFDLLMTLARIAKERGDFAVAMHSLKRASQIEPNREESYLQFSTICADHGNDQLALDSAEIGLSHVPASYRLTVQKGVEEAKLRRLTDAEATLDEAVGMQKDNSVALLSLAVVQAQSGRPDEAEKTLTSSLRRFPDNFYMHYLRGKFLLEFPNASPRGVDYLEPARHSLEKAVQLNPKYADAYFQLSSVYMSTSPRLAEQALRKCLQLDPDSIAAQYALGLLLARTGRRTEGAALLARLKSEQRANDQQQQKRLLIEIANN